jgi:uncharacterized protein YegJ (DUF2314 family)
MPRQIPVFSFVFAAFAATCPSFAEGPKAAPVRDRQCAPKKVADLTDAKAARFRDAWRSSTSDRKRFVVRLRMSEANVASGYRLLRSDEKALSSEEVVWLYDIAETSEGFLGIVRDAPERFQQLAPGQMIAFAQPEISDWKYLGAFEAATPLLDFLRPQALEPEDALDSFEALCP